MLEAAVLAAANKPPPEIDAALVPEEGEQAEDAEEEVQETDGVVEG